MLKAESFAPESWVQAQFLGFMNLYYPDNGLMIALIGTVPLLAPGTEHGRNYRYLWGQDLTALNPHHLSARELVRRYLHDHEMLKFLDTSASGGKLLKLEYMLDGNYPIFAAMDFAGRTESSTTYYFDRDARLWRYLNSHLPQNFGRKLIQERREDFAPTEGATTFDYNRGEGSWALAFRERATWAGIPVHGDLPEYGATRFNCMRAADDIQCYIE